MKILPPNPRGKILTNCQINPGSLDENKNSTVYNIKIYLDSSASASIVCKVVIHECHQNWKDKMNKWSTIAGTFNTTFITEIILKLLELNHSAVIYAKCHSTDKLSNYDLILGRDILHELGIIFVVLRNTILHIVIFIFHVFLSGEVILSCPMLSASTCFYAYSLDVCCCVYHFLFWMFGFDPVNQYS